MATDATGTPTSPDSIPTYNTAVDAPSGKGTNAMMAAIQTALSARISKPTGIVSGETPVWNGSGWDRSSVTRLGISSIASGTPTGLKFVRDDGTLAVPGAALASYQKVTAKDIVSSVTELDLLNSEITIAANAMGANGAVLGWLYGDMLYNNVGTDTLRLRIKFGANTQYDTGAVVPGATLGAARRGWILLLLIQNMNSTAAQDINLFFANTAGGTAPTTGTGPILNSTAQSAIGAGWGAGTEDTTASKALQVTAQWGTNSANDSMRLQGAKFWVMP